MRRTTFSRRALLARAGALGAYPFLPAALRARSGGPAPGPLAVSTSAAGGLALVNPRLAHPVFAEPGGVFNVEIATTQRLDPDGWSVQLRSDLGAAWSCAVVGTASDGIDYNRTAGHRLYVQAPHGISPELMTLEVSHRSSSARLRQERAVSIVPDLSSDGYLLHLTDEHVMYDSIRHYACSNPASGYRSADLVRWAAPVVNLINPRLVINSGDQAHQYATSGYRYNYNADIYACYLNAKRGYRVPSMMLLGNHEVHEKDAAQRARDWARWEGLAGRRSYHIRMGSLWLFAHDYLDPASRSFIDTIYRASFGQGGVQGRIFVQHHTSASGFRPPAEHAPLLMLVGHLHRQSVEDRSPYPILMSIAAHNYATGSLLRIARRDGRWTSDAANRWADCDLRLVGDYGTPNVAVSYAEPNDGRARSNLVSIHNRLAQGFEDGRVRLILRDGRYSVRGGDILSRYALADGSTVVLARVDIPRQDGLELEVTPQISSLFLTSAVPETGVTADPAADSVARDITGAPHSHAAPPADTSDGVLAPPDPGATLDTPEQLPARIFLPLVRQ